MRKILFTMMAVALLACPAMAARYRQHQVSIVDEFGDPVTNITSITVFNAGLGTSPTIFNDRAGTLTVTNPITTSSTNSTFDQSTGFVKWFQTAPDFKLTITDGTKTLTLDNLDEGDTRFPWFVNYIGTAASLSVGDNESITVGDDSDMVLAWNNGSDFMSWIPAADGSAFNLGTSGTGKNVDFNWFVDTALGIKGDEGAATLVIDGLTTSINASSNFATNINTGTSTGAVTIGSSTSGTLALDTTAGMTINADDSIGMTTSGAAANITIDALAGSVIIDGGEAVDDAVVVKSTGAAGGIDIISLGDIDITTTGAAGEDITIINTGGSITMTATEAIADAMTIGTSAAGGDLNLDSVLGRIEIEAEEDVANAVFIIVDGGNSSSMKFLNDTGISATDGSASIQMTSDLGGIELLSSLAAANQIRLNAAGTVAGNAVVLETTDGGILLNADGGTNGDIELNSADNMVFTSAGDLTFVVTDNTILPDDILLKTTTAISDTQMDNLAGTQIELVAAQAGKTIEFISAIFALDWVSVAWTEPSAPDDLVIRYVDGSGAIVSQLLDATGFATATEDTVAFLTPTVANAAGAAVASVAVTEAASTNKALVLDNTGDEWTNSGDSQVVVIVYYRLHTTAELGL